MRRTSRMAVVTLTACLAAAGVLLEGPGTTAQATAAPAAALPGSAPPAAYAGALAATGSASQRLTVQVWLTPDLAGATRFAEAAVTPGTARFRHYLSPDAYSSEFGPSAARATAVSAWLTGAGFTQVHADSGRNYVSATGTAARVQSVFQVRMDRYRVAGANGQTAVIQSNDRAVSVPRSLASDVLAVTGLDSAPAVTSVLAAAKTPVCSAYWGQHVQSYSPAYRGLTKGSLPVCGYSADQLRAAYEVPAAASGRGETVALVEDSGAPIAMPATLAVYAKRNHLPAPKPGQFREQQTTASGPCDATSLDAGPSYDVEAQMDSEAVYAMAPGASQLMVVDGGCDETQSLLDAITTVLKGNGVHPSASIVSNSWQIPLGAISAQAVHAVDLRAVAEGVGLYFASGDGSGLNATDSDPYATAVGGTTLGTGAKANRLFETGWSDDYADLEAGQWTDEGVSSASGGGVSLVWGEPTYQKGVVPASMSRVTVGKKTVNDRAVPDIAADGDPDSGMLVGYVSASSNSHPGPYLTMEQAGTSLATPLIAGLVADAQQGQKASFGFINPLLYRLSGTPAVHDVLPVTDALPQPDRDAYEPPSDGTAPALDVFDSQRPSDTQQVTAKGYDTMTGVGTPDGAAFIAALRRARGGK